MTHSQAAVATCRGKQTFPTRAKAMEVANWMWFHKGRAMSAYRCRIDGRHYHLTHMDKVVGTRSSESTGSEEGQ